MCVISSQTAPHLPRSVVPCGAAPRRFRQFNSIFLYSSTIRLYVLVLVPGPTSLPQPRSHAHDKRSQQLDGIPPSMELTPLARGHPDAMAAPPMEQPAKEATNVTPTLPPCAATVVDNTHFSHLPTHQDPAPSYGSGTALASPTNHQFCRFSSAHPCSTARPVPFDDQLQM